MLMVIFGAGASYDCDPSHPATTGDIARGRIPLAGDLFWAGFGEYAARYPACQGLLRRLRAAGREIEPELERIRAEARTKPFLVRELEAIRYYLMALISAREEEVFRELRDHVTTYIDLLQEVEDWREPRQEEVAMVTFNYDTLLDKASRSVVPELRLRRVLDYGTGHSHYMFKLHGSIDWHEELTFSSGEPPPANLPPLERANVLIDLAGSIHPRGRYVMDGEPMGGGSWGPLRPSIAIPMVTKGGDDFACPKEHIEKLSLAIPVVSDLVLVGWRGQEQHFHELWRESVQRAQKTQLRRLLVVDVNEQAAERIGALVRQAMGLSTGITHESVGGGFSAALEAGVFKRFLEAG